MKVVDNQISFNKTNLWSMLSDTVSYHKKGEHFHLLLN